MDGDQTGAGYSGHDRQRWVREPPKRRARTAFERDRARVLHSAALRRLAAKTQVVEPGVVTGENQHSPRTRLTHSLECAQIGRELGKVFGCDPDLVEAACLAHDLGHPPFGHNGEVALDTVAEPCGGFEGNAQSLRILTRLEPKAFAGASDAADLDRADRSAGLNLTRATLDACIKYPWFRDDSPIPGKYGVYPDDAPVFHWIREGAPPGRPCFEAQVMDWADDVAYSVHDLEDAVHVGYVGLDQLSDPGEVREVCELAARTYCEASVDELVETFARLRAQPFWPERYDGTARALAALKDLTSELIGRFCQAAEEATIAAFGPGPLRRYAADLIVPRPQRLECALLKAVAARYVMHREGHGARRARQRELIIELTELLSRGAPDTLDPAFRAAFHAARDDVSRLRVVIDQAASLTDTSAVAWHRRLTGR